MDFKNKKVLIVGFALSGNSAARLLLDSGAQVTVQDLKSEEQIGNIATELKQLGVEFYLGRNPDEILDDFDVIVVSPGVPAFLPFFRKAKLLQIPLIGEIELAALFTPCPIIAITGTNGKTTTTALVGEIMRAHNKKTVVVGNIGEPFTGKAGGLDEDSLVVAEISSFQLETVDTFHPKISCVLNITPDHLDRHGSIEAYVEAKERVYENQKKEEGDYLVLNKDDSYCVKMADKTNARVIYFSRSHEADAEVYCKENNIYIECFGYDEALLALDELQIPGEHNVENALAAVSIALCAGASPQTIAATIKSFKGVEHRLEYVADVSGIDFYNDSKATNVDSAIKGLLAMKKPVVLIGGGYDKGAEFDEWVKLFEGRVKSLIVLGETAQQIIRKARQYSFDEIKRTSDLEEAVEVAFEKAEAGDAVLLSPACASWDMFANFEERGRMFKKIVLGHKAARGVN